MEAALHVLIRSSSLLLFNIFCFAFVLLSPDSNREHFGKDKEIGSSVSICVSVYVYTGEAENICDTSVYDSQGRTYKL